MCGEYAFLKSKKVIYAHLCLEKGIGTAAKPSQAKHGTPYPTEQREFLTDSWALPYVNMRSSVPVSNRFCISQDTTEYKKGKPNTVQWGLLTGRQFPQDGTYAAIQEERTSEL